MKKKKIIIEPTNDIIFDIYRRDFIMNTLYFHVFKNELLDFFSILNSSKKVFMNLLSTNEFIYDPSRIIRALRYRDKYNLFLDENFFILVEESLIYWRKNKNIFLLKRIKNELMRKNN